MNVKNMLRASLLLAVLGAVPAIPAVAQTSSPDTDSYSVVDRDGNLVGTLTVAGAGKLAFRSALAPGIIGSAASMKRRAGSLDVDYSKALTPQQFDDAYRLAHDEFFGVDHSN